MRTIKLTEREKEIFFNTKIKEKDVQELMRKYIIKDIDSVRYVLCKRERDDGDDANFMNTGLALTGVLVKNETLEEFIEFVLRFRRVVEFRNRDSVIEAIKRNVKKGEI
jgi:hypothetical protein